MPHLTITKQPDGSFTLRDNKTYEQMLKEYNDYFTTNGNLLNDDKGKQKLLQQARMLSASISAQIEEREVVKDQLKNLNQSKKLNSTWQFELHD